MSSVVGTPILISGAAPHQPPRNYLIDNKTGEVYPWPLNHSTEDSLKTLGRRLSRSGVSKRVRLMMHATHPGPAHLVLNGNFIDRSQQQYQKFVDFFNDCEDRTFLYIDASGDAYIVSLMQYDARRVWAATREDGSFFTYTLEMEVIEVVQGPLMGYAS